MERKQIEPYILNKLKEGSAVFTVGVFCRIWDGEKVLLRKRVETSSITNANLAGKYELIGGTVELNDIEDNYYDTLKERLEKEIKEEAKIRLILPKYVVWAAFPTTRKTASKGILDIALLTDVEFDRFAINSEYEEMLNTKELIWANISDSSIELIGPRMENMLKFPRKLLCEHKWKYEELGVDDDLRERYRMECKICGKVNIYIEGEEDF